MTKTPLGPNMKRLIIHKVSVDAIPQGGGLGAGIGFLTSRGALMNGFRSAAEWCRSAVKAVRSAAEPNRWKEATDEEIAAEILRRLAARHSKQTAD